MKLLSVFLIVLGCWYQLPLALADSVSVSAGELELLAQRGKGVVTQEMFAARAAKIPADVRQEALRNVRRFQEVINKLLLNAQLVADAREAGLDKQPLIIKRMKLAADAELAEAWLQHYINSQPGADYAQLADEYYQLNPAEFMTPEMVNVSHILVSTRERAEPEALQLAVAIRQQLTENPVLFDELVEQYSEDPSVASNQGKFEAVKRGSMVAPFEAAAFALKQDEISQPVLSKFGYHIIRLDKSIAAKTISFDSVKLQLMDSARLQHLERIRKDYLRDLTSQDINMSEAAMQEMIRRLVDSDAQIGGAVDSE